MRLLIFIRGSMYSTRVQVRVLLSGTRVSDLAGPTPERHERPTTVRSEPTRTGGRAEPTVDRGFSAVQVEVRARQAPSRQRAKAEGTYSSLEVRQSRGFGIAPVRDGGNGDGQTMEGAGPRSFPGDPRPSRPSVGPLPEALAFMSSTLSLSTSTLLSLLPSQPQPLPRILPTLWLPPAGGQSADSDERPG